ncbi:MAG: endonuclease/exonuclease/phosphatase family protein [Ignavibacterium sp.]|nr:endonuclease/exonuclease/phosphatase family protein [Ignavibacterium sp.]MDW8375722.1 endonuclease/exonuclease/phosphatase family protein [Ignavibacteriales bacterium]
MTYNILNYPGNDPNTRNQFFSTIISSSNPDILVVQEITSLAGVNLFLNNVLKTINSSYQAGDFIDGPDSDNAIFFKSNFFTFISNTRIPTSLRDINEFKLVHNFTLDTLRIFSVHLKASSGTNNEQQRLAEVNVLRNYTLTLNPNSNYIVLGDFNFYSSNEPAYQRLLDQSASGYFTDVINITGVWNNPAYAIHHTQSPRVRAFGGGSTGGLDDRFDLILFSPAIIQQGGITYVNNSYTVYGNDGLHYNDSINRMPNYAVPQSVADALHYASDHLPVFALLNFEELLPVELINFTAKIIDQNILLTWETASEINNYGFVIERASNSSADKINWQSVGFVPGNGNSNSPRYYEFLDQNIPSGKIFYRLKQIDNDGSFKYSDHIEVEIKSANDFKLFQNYPNPFNSQTIISYFIPQDNFVNLKIYDVIGNEISTLVNEYQTAGYYDINFESSDLSSGIYIYKIFVGENSQHKKMIILK